LTWKRNAPGGTTFLAKKGNNRGIMNGEEIKKKTGHGGVKKGPWGQRKFERRGKSSSKRTRKRKGGGNAARGKGKKTTPLTAGGPGGRGTGHGQERKDWHDGLNNGKSTTEVRAPSWGKKEREKRHVSNNRATTKSSQA